MSRVALITVPDPDGDPLPWRGSGYRISSAHVLTAAHVLRGLDTAEVRFYTARGAWRDYPECAVVWQAPEIDLAVVELGEAYEDRVRDDWPAQWPQPVLQQTVEPVSFTRMPEDPGEVPYLAIGFPSFKYRGDEAPYDSEQVRGTIPVGANFPSGTLELKMDAPAGTLSAEDTPWGGLSGAAVCAGNAIIGVAVQDPLDEGGYRLLAESVESWYRIEAGPLERLRALTGLPAHPQDLTPAQALRDGLPPDGLTGTAPARPHGVVPHRQAMAELAVSDRYLVDAQLPFHEPPEASPSHPGRILRRLADDAARGVLLTGTAATGKTRTCLEVAERAHADNWQVLHLRTDTDVEVGDLDAALAGQPSARVLIVVDYLDQQPALSLRDLARWAERTMAGGPGEAADTQIRFLFTCHRSARDRLRGEDGGRLFTHAVTMDWNDAAHRQEVLRRIFTKVAPTALDSLGRAELTRRCGEQPMVALLLAAQAESQVRAGRPVAELDTSAPSALTGYLMRRLEQERVLLPGTCAGGEHTGLLGYAAAVAAAPAPYDDLAATVARTLRLPSGELDEAVGTTVVDTLSGLGWLRSYGDTVHTVHDVVADEILRTALFPGQGYSLDRTALGTLLRAHDSVADPAGAPGMAPGGLGGLHRLARGVARLYADAPPEHQDQLTRFCRAWMRENATELSSRLPTERQGVRLLVGMLVAPPWRTAAAENWAALRTAWTAPRAVTGEETTGGAVTGAEGGPQGVALLAVLLTQVPADHAQLLISDGIGLLTATAEETSGTPGAPSQTSQARHVPVLRALLNRTDLDPEQLAVVADAGLEWTDSEEGRAPGAKGVLHALLAQPDLDPARTRRAVGRAMRSHRRRPGALASGDLLRLVLARTDLAPATRREAVERALTWLGRRGERSDGDSTVPRLLSVLLTRSDLSADQQARLGKRTLEWLNGNADEEHASFVLQRWLARHPEAGTDVAEALALTVRWVGLHGNLPRAPYLLLDALNRPEATPHQQRSLIEAALDWLGSRDPDAALPANSDRLLRAVLLRPDLDDDLDRRVIDQAMEWLERHHRARSAAYPMQALLERGDLSNQQLQQTMRWAERWLDLHPMQAPAQYVLSALLTRYRPTAAEGGGTGEGSGDSTPYRRTLQRLIDWLEHQDNPHSQQQTGYALIALAGSHPFRPDDFPRIRPHALRWLEQHHDKVIAFGAVAVLLRDPGLSPEQEKHALRSATHWLATHAREQRAGMILSRLLPCTAHQPPEIRLPAIGYALDWLEQYHPMPGAGWVLEALALQPVLTARQSTDMVRYIVAWLKANAQASSAWYVLASVLSREDLPRAEAPALAAAVLARLRSLPEAASATDGILTSVLHQLLFLHRRHRLEDTRQARAFVRERIAQAPPRPSAASILNELLRPPFAPGEVTLVREQADRWLAAYEHDPEAGRVLSQLLRLDPPEAATRMAELAMACRWLDQHHLTTNANHVLQAVLAQPGLHSAVVGTVVDQSLAWLEAYPDTPQSIYLLRDLFARSDLRRSSAHRAVDYTLDWLDRRLRPTPPRPRPRTRARQRQQPRGRPDGVWSVAFTVLRAVFLTKDADFPQIARAEKLAGIWLDRYGGEDNAGFLIRDVLQRTQHNSAALTRTIPIALRWLRLHRHSMRAPHVLRPLLFRKDVDDDAAQTAVEAALVWLDRHTTDPAAYQVLEQLLRHRRLGSEQATRALAYADQWLADHSHSKEAPGLLSAVVSCPHPAAQTSAAKARKQLLCWLEGNAGRQEAHLALRSLVADPGLDDALRARIITYATTWIRTYPQRNGAPHLWHALLTQNPAPNGDPELITSAVQWCGRFRTKLPTAAALQALLARPDLRGDELHRAVRYARDWLAQHHQAGRALFVLHALMPRPGLDEETQHELLDRTEQWLTNRHPARATQLTATRTAPAHERIALATALLTESISSK
ncbi:serine protease [Streptomyces sp. RK75]|nr:serine protease [Streptomyces sp. RK75]MBQ0862203.1 serine protease [Streptomyces sp. RK75]